MRSEISGFCAFYGTPCKIPFTAMTPSVDTTMGKRVVGRMKLPLRDFADVITAMKGPGGTKSPGAEKRGAARMTVTAKINLHLMDDNRLVRSFSVLTRDISITGMGVLQSVALQSGQNVIVQLPRPQAPLFVISTVMHCRPLADGVLAVGLEFAEMATKETCELLMNNDTQQHAKIRESILS